MDDQEPERSLDGSGLPYRKPCLNCGATDYRYTESSCLGGEVKQRCDRCKDWPAPTMGHRLDVECSEFLCLPEKNPSHYEPIGGARIVTVPAVDLLLNGYMLGVIAMKVDSGTVSHEDALSLAELSGKFKDAVEAALSREAFVAVLEEAKRELAKEDPGAVEEIDQVGALLEKRRKVGLN